MDDVLIEIRNDLRLEPRGVYGMATRRAYLLVKMDDVLIEIRNDLRLEPRGVYGMATSAQGKLAVIKKVDKCSSLDPKAPPPDADAVIEQYNVLGAGPAVLEVVHSPANGSIECLTWVGEYLVTGHISGSASVIHPHSTEIKTTQLCPCPLWAVCALDDTRCVFVSHSAQVLVYDIAQKEVTIRRNLGVEQRLFSVASLDNLIAVGATGVIFILNDSGNILFTIQLERADRQLPTIVWSIAIIKSHAGLTVVAGDSRGVLTFHDAKNAALLKSIHLHQADILVVRAVVSEKLKNPQIMAAGVDPRIAIIENKNGSTWDSVAVITGAESDIRALAFYNERLFAGGADSLIYEVTKFYERRRMVLQNLPTDFSSSIMTGGKFSVVRGSNNMNVWTAGIGADGENADGTFQLKHDPKFLAKIYTQGTQIVTACALSECGSYLCVSTCENTSAYELAYSRKSPVKRLALRGSPSTAIGFLAKTVLLCHDDFGVRQYALDGGDQGEGKQIIEQYGCAIVSKIITMVNFAKIAVLTTRAQVFVIDINKGTSNLVPKLENCVPTSIALSAPNTLTVLYTSLHTENTKLVNQYSLSTTPKLIRDFSRQSLQPSPSIRPLFLSLASSSNNKSSHTALVDMTGGLVIFNEENTPCSTNWKQELDDEVLGWTLGWRRIKNKKTNDKQDVLSVIAIRRPPPTQAPFKLKKFGHN